MREGGGRQQSNPWRPALPFYIAIDLYTETQQGIDFCTNKSRKTPLLPLGPNIAARRWTDWEILGQKKTHVSKKKREKEDTVKQTVVKDTQTNVEGHLNPLIFLTDYQSVSLSLYLNIDTPVWGAPGYHCHSCDGMRGKLVHEAINIRKHSSFSSWVEGRCSNKQEGLRGKWQRNRWEGTSRDKICRRNRGDKIHRGRDWNAFKLSKQSEGLILYFKDINILIMTH